MKIELTQDLARELLHYSPETGVFTWKKRDISWFANKQQWSRWNNRYAGCCAGCVWVSPASGYSKRHIKFLGGTYAEHRVAWIWMRGLPVPPQIDHRNRDATDNRWDNLRASCGEKNQKNKSMHRRNKSGVTGVSWFAARGKWHARCNSSGEDHHIGYFDDIDEAAMAVMEFRASHGFDAEHGMALAHYHNQGR